MRVDLTFPHDYELNADAWLPPGPSGTRVLYYPGALEAGGHDGILLEVHPREGAAWLGLFAYGLTGASAVLSTPDRERFCVVAGGAGYLVSASQPERWEEIQVSPTICDVRTALERGLILFADYTSLTAYGRNGLAWQSPRLVIDELRVELVTADWARSRGWGNYDAAEVTVVVDLRTGLPIPTGSA